MSEHDDLDFEDEFPEFDDTYDSRDEYDDYRLETLWDDLAWADESHMTNFSPCDRPVYEAAIAAMGKEAGNYCIREDAYNIEGYRMLGALALHTTMYPPKVGVKAKFWDVFNDLKEKQAC